jgi:hypothetical protein
LVKLTAYDGSVEFHLMGGGSLPDPVSDPECVQINGPIKGLIAPWKFIDQQGANEDGVTNLDSVNEPAIVEIPVRIVARDGKHLRQVVDRLFGSCRQGDARLNCRGSRSSAASGGLMCGGPTNLRAG